MAASSSLPPTLGGASSSNVMAPRPEVSSGSSSRSTGLSSDRASSELKESLASQPIKPTLPLESCPPVSPVLFEEIKHGDLVIPGRCSHADSRSGVLSKVDKCPQCRAPVVAHELREVRLTGVTTVTLESFEKIKQRLELQEHQIQQFKLEIQKLETQLRESEEARRNLTLMMCEKLNAPSTESKPSEGKEEKVSTSIHKGKKHLQRKFSPAYAIAQELTLTREKLQRQLAAAALLKFSAGRQFKLAKALQTASVERFRQATKKEEKSSQEQFALIKQEMATLLSKISVDTEFSETKLIDLTNSLKRKQEEHKKKQKETANRFFFEMAMACKQKGSKEDRDEIDELIAKKKQQFIELEKAEEKEVKLLLQTVQNRRFKLEETRLFSDPKNEAPKEKPTAGMIGTPILTGVDEKKLASTATPQLLFDLIITGNYSKATILLQAKPKLASTYQSFKSSFKIDSEDDNEATPLFYILYLMQYQTTELSSPHVVNHQELEKLALLLIETFYLGKPTYMTLDDLNEEDDKTQTPLTLAIYLENDSIVRALLDRKVNTDNLYPFEESLLFTMKSILKRQLYIEWIRKLDQPATLAPRASM